MRSKLFENMIFLSYFLVSLIQCKALNFEEILGKLFGNLTESLPLLSSSPEDGCQNHPETWEEAIQKEENKQWPQAAQKQAPMDLAGIFEIPNPNPNNNMTCHMNIWQECLEFTISGMCINEVTQETFSKSPLHHYVADYTYGHSDQKNARFCRENTKNGNCYHSTGLFLNKALIVETTREWCEVYNARKHALLFVGANSSEPGAVIWNAVRAPDINGNVVFQQNSINETPNPPIILKRAIERSHEIKCPHRWDPDSEFCQQRSYLDAAWSYTPACCSSYENLDGYLESVDMNLYPNSSVQPYPNGLNVVYCDESKPSRMY